MLTNISIVKENKVKENKLERRVTYGFYGVSLNLIF
jgi:hypothetical protein